MNIKINHFLSIFLLGLIFLSVLSSPVFATKPSPNLKPTHPPKRIVVGANLKEYEPSKKTHCDINVPSQYAKIQVAINAAVSGNTICVGKGTYNEDILINKSIRLSGKGAYKTIINGQNPNADTVGITADNVTLEGFLINGIGTNVVVTINGSDSGPVSGVTVQYNRILAGNGGIALRTILAQNSLIQNNILQGNDSPYVAALGGLDGVGSTDNSFINNTFIGTVNPNSRSDTGITLDAATPNSIVKRNSFNTTGNQIVLLSAHITSLINENNFNSTTPIIKLHGGWGPLVLNAENNWWGDNDPSDNITGLVDYTPFATSPFKEN